MMQYLVCVAKNEHRYIKEWCDYHLDLGFDKIFIYNNDTIPYKLNNDKVIELNCSNITNPQPMVYNHCYQNFLNVGDWLTVLDCDEFLVIPDKIEPFLSRFNADVVRYNWQCYGDCGNVYYEDKPVLERFKTPAQIDCVYNADLPKGITENFHTKYSVKKTNKNAFLNIHSPIIPNGTQVNVLGDIVSELPWQKPIWEVAYVKHFITKSAEEFIERRFNKLDACGNVAATNNKLVERYFNLNTRTKEKEDLFYAKEKC